MNGLSEAVGRVLKRFGVNTAMRPHRTIRQSLVKAKDRREDRDKGEGVYKIACKNCTSAYIGETGRKLGTRLDEHRKEVNQTEQHRYTRANKQNSQRIMHKSALADHTSRENHVIDWEGAKMVANEHYTKARQIREAIWIKRTPNTMNRDAGVYPLARVYNTLITKSTAPSGGESDQRRE